MPNWKGYFAAKAEMEAPKKDTKGYGYMYATLAQVKSIVDPACSKHGIGYVQSQQCGTLFTRVVDAETGEDMVSDSRYLADGADQERGSSETYQRRYALLTVFGLAPEDDDGQAASQPPKPRQRAAKAKKAPEGADALKAAQQRLWTAVKGYAERSGGDPKAIAEGCKKRPDYAETAEWYAMVAAEFETA